jgi:E3 ubiquitin-protein ligase MARCH6
MHYFKPKRAIKNLSTFVWKSLATRFRLTSYFFGGRHHEEEYTPKTWRCFFFQPNIEMADVNDVPDGSFRRVPATDNIALPRDMRATVAVTAAGEPVDDNARKLMALQDAEANKAKRSIKDDYMLVYLPPFFRYRVIGFITLLWILGAISVGLGVALPIQLGRSFFKLFTSREVHDGYSFIIGFYLVWICCLAAKAIDRLDKRRQRRSGPRAGLYIVVLKRGLLWVAKVTYMTLSLGIVIPILLAIVIDLYIVLPIRFTLDPTLTPRIRIVETWALGLLYAKIAFHAHRIQPPNRIARGLQHVSSLSSFKFPGIDFFFSIQDHYTWLDGSRPCLCY